jgi:hypothetical protein
VKRSTKGNVAYVASTLPVAVLDAMIPIWKVNKIWVASNALGKSYLHLRSKHPDVCISQQLPGYVGVFQLAWIHLYSRLTRSNIFFFHECSCPIFDVLASIIKPYGHHYPQVHMGGFKKIPAREVALAQAFGRYILKLTRVFRLLDKFDFYQGCGDNGATFNVVSIREYPSSIKRHSVLESGSITLARLSLISTNNGNIVFLAGRDAVQDGDLKNIYMKLITMATKIGYKCYIKDHPNPSGRLNITHSDATVIDPYVPIELIVDRFAVAIGVASTGLVYFRTRAVSFLEITGMPADEVIFRKQHLLGLQGGASITFVNDLKEFPAVVENVANQTEG